MRVAREKPEFAASPLRWFQRRNPAHEKTRAPPEKTAAAGTKRTLTITQPISAFDPKWSFIGARRDGLSWLRNPHLVRAIHLPLFPRGLERLNQSGKQALHVGDLVIRAKITLD